MPDLTVADAARISGLSPATIKRKIASGELESRTDRKGWHRVEHETLMRFLTTLDQPKSRSGAVAHHQNLSAQRANQSELVDVLKKELELARERVKVLEARNDKLSSEIMSLTSELRELVFGGGRPGLSAWMSRVEPKDFREQQETIYTAAAVQSEPPRVTQLNTLEAKSKPKRKSLKLNAKKKPGPKPKVKARSPGTLTKSKNKKRRN